MRLSDYKGEDALDLLAEIIEPASEIMADKEVARLIKTEGTPIFKIVKPMIKNHKAAIIQILATLEGEDVEEYRNKVTVLTLPKKLLEMLNDTSLKELFQSQGQTLTSSGSATENTEENGQ